MLVTINRCVAQKAALAPSAVVARMLNTFSQQEVSRVVLASRGDVQRWRSALAFSISQYIRSCPP
jgi:hypothetical protein